jgi:hypothetical protein
MLLFDLAQSGRSAPSRIVGVDAAALAASPVLLPGGG